MDCVRRDCGYFNRTPRSPCAPFDGKRRSLGVDLVGAKSELAIGGAKLSGSAKVALSVADSEIRWAELVPSRTVLTLSVQIGPREIGADLAFGVDLALFILQCRFLFSEEKFIVRYSAHSLAKTCIQLQVQLEANKALMSPKKILNVDLHSLYDLPSCTEFFFIDFTK